jgi:hypothetical protein
MSAATHTQHPRPVLRFLGFAGDFEMPGREARVSGHAPRPFKVRLHGIDSAQCPPVSAIAHPEATGIREDPNGQLHNRATAGRDRRARPRSSPPVERAYLLARGRLLRAWSSAARSWKAPSPTTRLLASSLAASLTLLRVVLPRLGLRARAPAQSDVLSRTLIPGRGSDERRLWQGVSAGLAGLISRRT